MITNHTSSNTMSTSNHLFKAILFAGLIAGTLDITAAVLVSGASLCTVLHYIASGAFGRETAFSGGLLMAFVGLIFHYLIAYCWTTLYFLVYPKMPILSRSRIVSALAYGVVVWTVMNLVVVPLSAIPARPFNPTNALINCVVLMLAIGVPVSFLAHRYYSKRR